MAPAQGAEIRRFPGGRTRGVINPRVERQPADVVVLAHRRRPVPSTAAAPPLPDRSAEMLLISAMFMVLDRDQQLKVTQAIFRASREDRDCPVIRQALAHADRLWGL